MATKTKYKKAVVKLQCELRKVKIARHLSRETTAFTAELWINGKKAANVENDGQGGCDRLYFVDHETDNLFELYIQSLPKVECYGKMLPMSAEMFIEDLLNDYEEAAQLKRWCKTKTVLKMRGSKPGEFTTISTPYSADVKQRMTAKYGDKIEEIVNERYQTVQ